MCCFTNAEAQESLQTVPTLGLSFLSYFSVLLGSDFISNRVSPRGGKMAPGSSRLVWAFGFIILGKETYALPEFTRQDGREQCLALPG